MIMYDAFLPSYELLAEQRDICMLRFVTFKLLKLLLVVSFRFGIKYVYENWSFG